MVRIHTSRNNTIPSCYIPESGKRCDEQNANNSAKRAENPGHKANGITVILKATTVSDSNFSSV